MFAEVIGVIRGLLSRAYWFGYFLPVALSAGIHAFLAHLAFPEFTPWDFITTNGSSAAKFPLVFAALLVAAYTVAPLLPWIRGILDGSLLPAVLHDALRRSHAAELRKTREQIGENYRLFGQYTILRREQTQKFRFARLLGDQLKVAPSPTAINNAAAICYSFIQHVHSGTIPSLEVAKRACEALESVLKTNSAEQHALLDQIQRKLVVALEYVEIDARHQAESFAERNGGQLDLANPQATRMGDVRNVIKTYCQNSYGVEFQYIWPRLQLCFPEKGDVPDRIVSLQAQNDFSVLSLTFTLVTAVVWLPLLSVGANSPWALVFVVLAIPTLLSFFYDLSLQSELTLSELQKSLIDKYRFDLVKSVLSLPVPPTLFSERILWRDIANSQTRGLDTNLTYRHPQL